MKEDSAGGGVLTGDAPAFLRFLEFLGFLRIVQFLPLQLCCGYVTRLTLTLDVSQTHIHASMSGAAHTFLDLLQPSHCVLALDLLMSAVTFSPRSNVNVRCWCQLTTSCHPFIYENGLSTLPSSTLNYF